MTPRRIFSKVANHEQLNFLLTNRIPRQALTRLTGWFSQIEKPIIARPSIAIWRALTDLDLTDAKKTKFKSMHDCFTRELKEGARLIDTDPATLSSPCDAIVGACGRIDDTRLIQAKGFPYTLFDLLADHELVDRYRDGMYVTLRLTSTMYHRFHSPADLTVERVTYISGDTWNVNPITLRRIEKLYCKNERAVIRCRLKASQQLITLVPVAAVLVASIRLHFLNVLLHLKFKGPNVIDCDAAIAKGEEMGWFQHGSTIIVFAPRGFALAADIVNGRRIKMGQALLKMQPVHPPKTD